MNTKNQFKWLLNALLIMGFLGSYFLELTGVAVHQWLGLAIGAVALMHLLNHWQWVRAVTTHFFSSTSNRSRLYYILDGALMVGLGMLILTGVIISTWFDVSGLAYQVWHRLHVVASIVSLGWLIIKLFLHWKAIANALKHFFAPQYSRAPSPILPAQSESANLVTRRDALRVMGAISLVGAAAMVKAGLGLQIPTGLGTKGASVDDQLAQPQVTTTALQPTASVSQANYPAPTATAVPVTNQPSSSCVYRCPRGNHCDYPGRCRLYIDENDNGFCDLGECL